MASIDKDSMFKKWQPFDLSSRLFARCAMALDAAGGHHSRLSETLVFGMPPDAQLSNHPACVFLSVFLEIFFGSKAQRPQGLSSFGRDLLFLPWRLKPIHTSN